jgi:hypothetical protein
LQGDWFFGSLREDPFVSILKSEREEQFTFSSCLQPPEVVGRIEGHCSDALTNGMLPIVILHLCLEREERDQLESLSGLRPGSEARSNKLHALFDMEKTCEGGIKDMKFGTQTLKSFQIFHLLFLKLRYRGYFLFTIDNIAIDSDLELYIGNRLEQAGADWVYSWKRNVEFYKRFALLFAE